MNALAAGLDFTGRSAVVTGAGGGIGLAIANALIEAGADATLIDVKPEPADVAAGPGRARYRRLDVTDEGAVRRALGEAHEWRGRLDGLANVHGVNLWERDGSVLDGDMAGWEETLHTNLTSMAYLARHAVPMMRASGGGAMVHFSSIQCLRGDFKPQDGYQVSKAGVVALSKSLAIQLAADGIRSNAILPGYTDTPMQARWSNDARHREAAARLVPLGRIARPREIAHVCLFLLSDLASYVTGVEVIVDGGLTALPAVGA